MKYKSNFFRFFLVYMTVFTTLVTGCKSASSDIQAAIEPAIEIENIFSQDQVRTGYRFDQSLIQPNNNQIIRTDSNNLKRSISDLNDNNVTYCESVDGQQNQYTGIRDMTSYPLASLSKIFLSAWALDKLGPDYKFENQWYLKKINGTEYDVYFRSNYDPILNIEKILYAISLMKARGVLKIRQLVIDETARVYLSVLNDPHVELTEVPVTIEKSIENLKIILNSVNWGSQTEQAQLNLFQFSKDNNRVIEIPKQFSTAEVIYKQSKTIDLNSYDSVIKMSSVILLKYLKELNVNSNNYITDMLFQTMGGPAEFRKFQKMRLNLNESDLQIYTGSGLPVYILGSRQDNKGSCYSVLKTLKFIKNLSTQLSFDMGHLLLVAGLDQGTYQASLPVRFNQALAIKTGRLFDVPALNIAGTANTQSGTLYFTYMAHDFNNDQEFEYKNKRDRILNNILNFYSMQSAYKTLKLSPLFAN